MVKIVALLAVLAAGAVPARAQSTTTIFTSQVPTNAAAASKPIEVGVKFRSDSPGTAIGVRFFKLNATNSGSHVGDLWSASGTLLASATFTGETASGWQTVLFSTPVAIQANTTYVASYHTTTQYSVSRNYFTGAGLDNPPLHALQSGVSGVNGVYAYGSGPTFPVNGVSDSNWWADVVFRPATSPPPPDGCAVSAGSWQNFSFAAQTGTFQTRFDAVPLQGSMDGVAGVSASADSDVTQLAAIVRFSTGGFIDARDGGGYHASSPVPYVVGSTHTFRVEVNVPTKRYNAYVSVNGSAEQLLASNFAFRTEQSGVSSLADLGALADVGSERVCPPVISAWTPAASSWTAVASMPEAHNDFAMTLLFSGKALVIGGSVFDPQFASALYDPASNTWSSTGLLNDAREHPTATLLQSGKVLVAGGQGANEPLQTAELFDPATNTYVRTGSLSEARTNHSAVLLPSGRVLVAGGPDATAELYDPDSGTWSLTGSMSAVRKRFTLTLLPNGKVLAAGGFNESSTVLSSAEIYDPATGTWTATAPMSTARTEHAAVLLRNGRVLVAAGSGSATGRSALASAEVYDPAFGTWSAAAPMAAARAYPQAVERGDGTILVAGGTGNTDATASLASAELYDPATDAWTSAGSMTTQRVFFGAVGLDDGRVLVAGGQNAVGNALASAEVYAASPVPKPVPPSIASIAPSSAAAGSGTFALSVIGHNFSTSSVVQWNGTSRPTTFVSTTALTGTVFAGDVQAAGQFPVTVTDPEGGASNVAQFTVSGGIHIASISPNSALAGSGAFTLSVFGQGFSTTSVVQWNNSARTTTFVSASTLTASISASDVLNPAVDGVSVVDQKGPSDSVQFVVLQSSPTPQWTQTGPLAYSHVNQPAARLLDGRVFIPGGDGDRQIPSEIYDPATDSWSAAGSASLEYDRSATTLPDGRVLLAGGATAEGCCGAASYIFNPGNTSYTTTGNLNNGHSRHSATLLGDGRVLVVGGQTQDDPSFLTASAELYNPASGSWSLTGSMATARVGHVAVRLADGRVLVAGGSTSTTTASATASVEIYSPASGTWSAASPMSTPRQGAAAALFNDGRVLVAGGAASGATGLATAEIFDPATGKWTATGSMAAARLGAAATLLADGSILVAGGATTTSGFNSAERYDPAAGTWSSAGSLHFPRANQSAIPLQSGRVLEVDGESSSAFQSTAETYDPGPFLAALSPSAAAAGGPGLTLSVTGLLFSTSSVLRWNGSPRATTFVSASTITAAITSSDIASTGTVQVSVSDPFGSSRPLTFTISPAAVSASTTTIFTTQAPTNAASASKAIEVGVKFQSDSAGSVVGVRFYKLNTSNSGAHTGELWSASGQLLASGTFTGETASGWQTVLFSTPVAIVANTTYVASYHTTTQYSVTRNYFTSAGVDNAPLHALKSGVSGVDGVYAYGAGPTFPTNGVSDSNWWADVVFQSTGSVAPPPPPPPPPASSTRTIVSLTFDDSTSSHTVAQRVLDAHGVKGTFFVISGRVGSPGYLTLPQVRSIGADGHEIAGHTVDHPDLTTLTSSAVVHEICDDKTQLQAWGFKPFNFAYPFGAANSSVEAAVKSCGYASARGVGGVACPGCKAAETIPPADVYYIGTPESIKSSTTLAEMETYVTNAERSGGGWVLLVMHNIEDNPSDTYSTSSATLSAFLDWLVPRASSGTVVKRIGDVMGTPVAAPAPYLASLSPQSAQAGGSSFTLTAFGLGFSTSSVLRWNGAARPTTFVSASTITAAIPASDLAAGGTVQITVADPTGVSTSAPFSVDSGPIATSTSTITIFTAQAPTNASTASSPIEVGVKFRSDSAGNVVGVRFYKLNTANTGTHLGELWSSSGQLLASATFSNETASGWQTVLFSNPVAIAANTVYVASYHTTTQYSVSRNFFTNAAVDNAPLHALQSGVSGVNGVYAYGSGPTFPTNGVSDSNWWADVVFQPAASASPASELAASSLATATSTATLPADSFGFRDLYVFPNPSRRGQRMTIRLQTGLADTATVRIYDVSGRLIGEGDFGPPKVLDDGNGKGPQYTYDYPWDVGSLGSGVYIFSVSAKKSGQSVSKTGKGAIIK